MGGFDDILKKGKDKAKDTSSGPKSKKDVWMDNISILISVMGKLNSMYTDDSKHHFLVEQTRCHVCRKATFLITIKSLDDSTQTIRYHNANWKVVGKDLYYCEKCK
jgi:hypothetical protein